MRPRLQISFRSVAAEPPAPLCAVAANAGQEDRRRVLLILHRLREPQSVHDPAARSVKGCAQRGRTELAGLAAIPTEWHPRYPWGRTPVHLPSRWMLCLCPNAFAPVELCSRHACRRAPRRTRCAWPATWLSTRSSSPVVEPSRWPLPLHSRRSRSRLVACTSGRTARSHRRSRCVAVRAAPHSSRLSRCHWALSGVGVQAVGPVGGQRGSPEGPSLVKPASVVHP